MDVKVATYDNLTAVSCEDLREFFIKALRRRLTGGSVDDDVDRGRCRECMRASDDFKGRRLYSERNAFRREAVA